MSKGTLFKNDFSNIQEGSRFIYAYDEDGPSIAFAKVDSISKNGDFIFFSDLLVAPGYLETLSCDLWEMDDEFQIIEVFSEHKEFFAHHELTQKYPEWIV